MGPGSECRRKRSRGKERLVLHILCFVWFVFASVELLNERKGGIPRARRRRSCVAERLIEKHATCFGDAVTRCS